MAALIGILQTCRFLRLWPVTIALGSARNGIVLLSNSLRLLAFPAAYLALSSTPSWRGCLWRSFSSKYLCF
jgi:hypothetical protein